MKNVILLTFMSFLCLATSHAEHIDRGSRNTQFITYDGGNDIQSVIISDVQEDWVTETRQVRSTCTRRIPVTRRVCRSSRSHHYNSEHHGRSHHGRRGGRYGRPPREECRTETTYRTESYTCYKPETVRTRRPDRWYNASVDIKFKNLSRDRYSYGRADFLVRLDRDVLTIELQGQDPRGQYLFFMKDKTTQDRFGDTTDIRGMIKVLVFDKDEFLRPVQQRIDVRSEVHHGELVMKMGNVVFEKGLGIDLTLTGDYGRTLFSGNVPKDFITVRDGRYGDDSIVIVDLDRLLRGTLRRGEHVDMVANVSLMSKDLQLLNFRHVPQLDQRVRAYLSIY